MVAQTATRTGRVSEDQHPLMTTEQLIERVRTLNPTARVEYLARFDRLALANYLDHLISAMEPRGPRARWVRPLETPAISKFVPAD